VTAPPGVTGAPFRKGPGARVIARTALLGSIGTLGVAWAAWALSKSRTCQLFGELVTRVETTDSVVAVTFDDGPAPAYTDSVLTVLADSNVRATFFVVGSGLERHADLGRRIVAAGHELGNHSYSHQRMVWKTPAFVRREVEQTDSLIRLAGQGGAIGFRPPYGKRLVILPWFLSRTGRVTVLWDVEPDSDPEVARDPDRLVDHVVKHVRPGSIILLHVETRARASSRVALPRLLGALRGAGYEFVTVSQLMCGASEAAPSPVAICDRSAAPTP
jgi:peptidoglycan/xylan/chitin deacetylase (PgdA/CDA1 family)